MKLFRRGLIAVIFVAMIVSALDLQFFMPLNYGNSGIVAMVLLASILASLAWSAIFLKVEPNLTRAALIADFILLLVICVWASVSMTD